MLRLVQKGYVLASTTELQERSRPINAARPDDVDSDEEGALARECSESTALTSSAASAGQGATDKMDHSAEVLEVPNTKMEEDIYGFAATSLIRDTRMMKKGDGSFNLRLSRLVMAQLLVFLNVFLQFMLLLNAKIYVTTHHVEEIRNVYDQFEFHMYGSDESHTYLTVNGKHRGTDDKYFKPELFESLPDEVKSQVCRISISHPKFFMIVILIWTLTCLGDMKANIDMMWSLVYSTPTIPAMDRAIAWEGYIEKDATQERQELMARRLQEIHNNERLVIGLSWPVKAYLVVFISLPRLLISLCLLWLGSRWLLSTIGFDDIILNAVALEFVLLLKDLLYKTVVPLRNKMDVQYTLILPTDTQLEPGFISFLGSFIWFAVAVCWTIFYCTRLQMVLPGYRWDVREVCQAYMKEMLADMR